MSGEGGENTPAEAALAAAIELEKQGERASAFAMFGKHRAKWPEVPLSYDRAIERPALQSGAAAAAVWHLSRVRDRSGASVPQALRRNLGSALLKYGRVLQAGREFSIVKADRGTLSRQAIVAAERRGKSLVLLPGWEACFLQSRRHTRMLFGLNLPTGMAQKR